MHPVSRNTTPTSVEEKIESIAVKDRASFLNQSLCVHTAYRLTAETQPSGFALAKA